MRFTSTAGTRKRSGNPHPKSPWRAARYRDDETVWRICGHPRTPENTDRPAAYRARGWAGHCRTCAAARSTKAWKDGKAQRAGWTRYGIDPTFTWDDYQRLLAKQGGVCAMCGQPPRGQQFQVDHDHERQHQVGNVRGLVHGICNHTVGILEGIARRHADQRDWLLSYLTVAIEPDPYLMERAS